MKKAKGLFVLLGTAALLFSCSQSLSRVEATEVLDRIVLTVKSKDFEKPTSYNVNYREYNNKTLTETTISFSFANTSKNHYSHRKTTVKVYEEDPKTNSKAAYTVHTKDEYDYVDSLATSSNFISYTEIKENKYTSEGPSSEENEANVTFAQVEGENALTEWENKMNESGSQLDMFTKDIETKPTELDRYLKRLSSDQDTYVKESEFNSLGEGNLDVYIVTVVGESEESRTFKYEEYLIKRYEVITSEKTTSASYSWNSFKTVYPDLNKASSEVSQSSLN